MTRPFLRSLLASAVFVLVLPAAAQGVDTYQIDAVHSNVGFKVRHLISKVTGRFAGIQGQVLFDTKDITRSSVDVTIAAATVDTGVEARDKHLKGPDFFDVATFPAITFKSTSVKEVAPGKLEVTGAFTLHGVTHTLILPVTNLGTTAGMKPGSVVAGFEAVLKLNRSDYGMKTMIGPLGDEVEITLNIEAGKVGH